MITLYGFGAAFGLPDPSPFVVKTEVLLKMAGVSYTLVRGDVPQAPKKKIPYIEDGGVKIGDSTFIRLHLEKKYAAEFDKGLSAEQKALAWAVEKMLEDNFYFTMLHSRWMDDANFNKGPKHIFDKLPALIRPFITNMVRKKISNQLYAQGMGRHSHEEIALLAARDIDAVATLLSDKPYITGNVICGADATMFAFIDGTLCKHFDSPHRTAAEKHANLIAYCARMREKFYSTTPSTQAAA